MQQRAVPDDWWPEWLQDLAGEDPLAEALVAIGEIEETREEHSRYRHLFTGLVPTKHLDEVLEYSGAIGHSVSASGPHPVDSRGQWSYSPRFWIHAPKFLPRGLEPLVVSWKSGN
ncbi:MAG: hypothetical protein ACYC3V_19125, partial [Chloroflexota bacterium]